MAASQVPKEFTAAKSQNFEFLVDLCLKQNLRTQIQLKKHRNMSLNSRLKSIRLHFATEQTQVFAGPKCHRGKSSSEKPKAPKTKGGKKLSKKKIGIISAIAVLVIALVAAFFYFQSTTRVEVTADKFIKAVDTSDHREAADLLSTDNDKWTKDEAESLITSMEDQGDRYRHRELNKIIDNGGEGSYTDKSGNKIFGLEKGGQEIWNLPRIPCDQLSSASQGQDQFGPSQTQSGSQ